MELLKWAAQEVINSVKVSKRSREGNNEVWNNFGGDGFGATCIAVTTLNLEIVRASTREGIPSIWMPSFLHGWLTHERNVISADVFMMEKVIDSGFVPVLHKKAMLDEVLDCTILDGDVIIHPFAA